MRSAVRCSLFAVRPGAPARDARRPPRARTAPALERGAARTLIRVETAGSGAFDWWTGRDKTLRVLIDGSEAGALTAWNGRFEADVEPGRHTVQIREGALFKSGMVEATVGRGSAATLVCHRNGFTGGIPLAPKA
jgi:hypothetical protein